MKEIKVDANRWRETPCSWTGRISIWNMAVLPKAVYRCSLPMVFFTHSVSKHRNTLSPRLPWPQIQEQPTSNSNSLRNSSLGVQARLYWGPCCSEVDWGWTTSFIACLLSPRTGVTLFLIWGEGRGGVAKMFYPPLRDLEGRGHVLESKLGVDRTNMPQGEEER